MPKKTTSRTQNQLVAENEDLRARLAEAEETLRTIYSGEVDALVVSGVGGEQIFTLKGADRSYRVLIEDMSEGALTLTAEGVILYANRRFAEMLKTPLEKVIGSSIYTWIALDSQQILQSLLRKGADEKLREQLVLTASDGTPVPAYLSINHLPTDEAPASFCLVATDLTERKRSEAIAASETLARELLAASNQSRLALLSVIEDQKQAEEALRESEAKYRGLVAEISDGIFITDDRGALIFVNPALAQIHGFEHPDQLVGRTFMEFIAPSMLNEVTRYFRQVVEGKQPKVAITIELVRPDGTQAVVEVNASARQVGGKVVGTQGIVRDITERKHAEAALRNSEIKLRSLFAAMTDVIIVYDADGCYLEIAPTNPTNLYRPLDDMLGKTVTELLPPDRASFFLDLIRQTLKVGQIRNAEYSLNFGDQVRWFSASVSPLSSNSVIWVAHDITHHKATEEALRESEKRYQNLATISPVGIFRTEKNGVTIYVNPMWCQISGLSVDEALGIGWQSAVHPEDKDNLIKDWQESIRLHRASHSEYRFVRPDGMIAWVLGQAVPEMNSENQIEGYVGTITDITERKRMEEKLEEERILLRTLIDNLPDRIYVMDVQGHKLLSNLADWQASGRKMMEDVIGKTDFDTFPPDLAEDYWALDKSVIDTGKPIINVEEPGYDSQGNPVILSSSKVPLRDNQGKVVGLVGIGHDITEHKQWEEEIRSRNDELSALYQLSRILADANNLESVIELVLRHAVESVHITFACLALVEDGELVRRAVYPVRVLDHDFKIGFRQPLSALPGCQRVLDKNEPVILQAGSPEVGSTERETLMLDFAESVCLVPLQVGDPSQNLSQVLGLLILGEVRGLKREPFTPDKVRMARSIGDQAAAALRRMLSREQAGRRLQRLASLSEIDRTIASNIDLRFSLKMILKHVSEQLEVDAADVLVFNDSLRTLEFAAGRGFRSSAIERTRLRIGEGQAGRAALERNIVQIPDVAASEVTFAQSELLKGEHITAYFAVPLITKGQIKGVLEIYHRSQLEPNEEWLDFLNSLAGQAAIAIDNVQLFDNLQHSNTELALAYDATIEGWSHALDLRDKETEGHTQRVTEMTVKLVRAFGLSEAELVQVRWGALLHDIGKLGVPDGILLKPGPLTDEEWVAMKKHPTFAYELLSPIRYLRLALDIPYCHHEKWDGTGYPRGLKGDQIPLVARIFAVVDVWDALRSDRPYRSAWTEEKVREHIRVSSGTHFDPRVVDLFMQVPNLI
jgi:PAS domain S-box-containing protein